MVNVTKAFLEMQNKELLNEIGRLNDEKEKLINEIKNLKNRGAGRRSVINDEIISNVKKLYFDENVPMLDISRKLGVSKGTIYKIVCQLREDQ